MTNTPLHDLATLRSMYDMKPLAHIESVAQGFHVAEVNAHRLLLSILSYLEHTRRYREDPAFATADFESYLKSRFDMTYARYSLGKTAYIRYPELTQAHGVGFVTDAARRCGLDRMDDLVAAIKALDSATAEELEALVAAFARPQERQTRTDWKSKYLALAEETEQLRRDMDLRDAEISRLKKDLDAARNANRTIESIMATIRRSDAVKNPVAVETKTAPLLAPPRPTRSYRASRPPVIGRHRSCRAHHPYQEQS